MPLGSWLRSGVTSLFKGKGKTDPYRGFATSGAVNGPSLNSWTDSRIDQVRAFKHWTYIAVSRIADRVACQTPNVGRVISADPDSRKHHLPEWARTKALTPVHSFEDIEPVGRDHPLARLLSDPNEPDTGYDLWYETILFLLLTGNAYWWVPKNRITGMPAAIWVIPSHWMWPTYDDTGVVVEYEMRPAEGNYLRKTFPADEIVHIRKKSPISKVDGYSAQTAGAQWLDIHNSVERSRWFTFKNQAFPSVALEMDPQFFDPTGEDLDRIEQKFMARYAGETRAGKPMIIPAGVKLHKLSLMPREMDYCDSADQLRDNILGLFGVPAIIAGIAKEMSPGAILGAHAVFCSIAINPLCRLIGQALSEKLATKFDPTLKIWWEDTTPDDPAMVEKQLKTDMDGMAITPNEQRRRRGRAPYKFGGDDPILPHVGLILPWGSGKDINAINPFTQPNLQKPKKPKPISEEDEDEESSEDE